ncbi:EAL and HDOD domain-containing protein [Pseudocolwellia agarivorans]|uniref:EAL and HDOD domain-containing protein n=1 Tax=Pseudocolwellia agarivorans TaxID=1911682 RepID=UPI000986640C|nr:HDOD domain-containing protein [Pseudocolwellia agarivorans]
MEDPLNFTCCLDTQYIARHRIVDNKKNVFAYELLYRNSENNFFPSYINDSVATSRLLFNSLLVQEIERISNGALIFINTSNYYSLNYIAATLNIDNLVVEIVERTQNIVEVHRAIKDLKKKHVKFALDDYDGTEKWDGILGDVDFIKLEVEEPLIRTLFKIKKLKYKYPNKKIIVERIENENTFRQLKNAGCDYFQGFFFEKPEMLKLNNIVPSQNIMIELSNLANNKRLNFPLIYQKIAKDVGLTTRLLRIANNLLKDKNISFSSISQAITYIGEDAIKQFLMLMVMTNPVEKNISKLSIISLARAQFIIEMLNEEHGEYTDIGYLVGLISLLDVMLETDFETLLFEFNLSSDCARSLLYHQGVVGNLLLICKMIEKNKWFDVSSLSREYCWNMDKIIKTFDKASKFSNEALKITV